MTSTPPPGERPAAAGAPRRQVALPGGQQQRQRQRRFGLAGLGLVLVLGCGFGFWYILRSIDERGEYLMASRTLERWDVVGAGDFEIVEADVGAASALTPDRRGAVSGKWATGRVPAGTIITEGLFETPPLSSESDAGRVQMQVSLPSGEAPFGTLETGDTIALLGRESSGPDGEQGALGLIGVLQLDFVEGDDLHYVVTPDEALQIKATVDRYSQASDRIMWKLGFDLGAEELVQALRRAAGAVPAGAAPAFEPVEGQ